MARKYQTKKGKRAAPYRPKSRAKSASKKSTVKSKNQKLMKQMMKAFALAKGEEE